MNPLIKILFTLILSFSFSAFAESFPADFPEIPKGRWNYGKYEITKITEQELLKHQTPEGQKRIQELKKEGYTCLRIKIDTTKCSKNRAPQANDPDFTDPLKQKVSGIYFVFPDNPSTPNIVYDGASQEWLMNDSVQISQARVSLYKITRTVEGKYFLTFPITDEQPIGLLSIEYHQLKLPLIANVSNNNKTTSYFIQCLFSEQLK